MRKKLTLAVLSLVTFLAISTTTANAYWIADYRCTTTMGVTCCKELRCVETGCHWVQEGCYTG